MMRSVQEAVSDADAVLAIVDASRKPQEALAMLQPGPDWDGPPMAVVSGGGGWTAASCAACVWPVPYNHVTLQYACTISTTHME